MIDNIYLSRFAFENAFTYVKREYSVILKLYMHSYIFLLLLIPLILQLNLIVSVI